MSKEEQPLFQDVRILRAFRPGDVVFMTCARPLKREEQAHFAAELKRMLPEIRVVILRDGVEIVGSEETIPRVETEPTG